MVDSGQSLEANDSHTTALGDVDGDGDLDMVVADTSNQGDQVYLNMLSQILPGAHCRCRVSNQKGQT